MFVWVSVIAKNRGQENAILCFIKKSIGYLITATWFSLVSGLVGTGQSWWVARWMCFPVSDDYLIFCRSRRKEELCSIWPVCRLLPGHVYPLPADVTYRMTHPCVAELNKTSEIARSRADLGIFPTLSPHLYFTHLLCFHWTHWAVSLSLLPFSLTDAVGQREMCISSLFYLVPHQSFKREL